MTTLLGVMPVVLLLACSRQLSSPAATETATLTHTTAVYRTVYVSTASQLTSALANALPGDSIVLADGTYSGHFTMAVSGTAAVPIILQGSRNAILDGGDINTGYVLHLKAAYCTVRGFTVRNGLKGIMTDGTVYNLIDSVRVYNIGEEGIHLRTFSSHNTILRCDISYTGLKTPGYGEGVYMGSAKNNWGTYTGGNPDKSDSNQVLNNHIGPNVAAECIDVKEGTTGGLVSGNYFDASGITGANSADSWLDVKGNYYNIDGNTGYNPSGSVLVDGFQVHCVYSGWGNYNVFTNNNCTVNASGYGFNIQLSGSNGTTVGNKVYSNNTVTEAVSGVSNIALSN
ncbi:coagulation factor 5/8 type domain-containing protein [Niastella vici]|uniref:Coagulation factor 5/8 type domain-containing protein n=1 Tax=Niastella vici TaxID=1703345 RepID=A0A1V9FQT8_9BACT|nr:right-handed parallel beta-helix repeat-containing protein [Niastella vici]OQP60616.1 coagulation factor 5/8 type domain-containing protein [Niastella vici]